MSGLKLDEKIWRAVEERFYKKVKKCPTCNCSETVTKGACPRIIVVEDRDMDEWLNYQYKYQPYCSLKGISCFEYTCPDGTKVVVYRKSEVLEIK